MWLKTVTIHIFPNISQSKSNLTLKFGKLIEYNRNVFFLNNHTENEAGRLVPDYFFQKKSLMR